MRGSIRGAECWKTSCVVEFCLTNVVDVAESDEPTTAQLVMMMNAVNNAHKEFKTFMFLSLHLSNASRCVEKHFVVVTHMVKSLFSKHVPL